MSKIKSNKILACADFPVRNIHKRVSGLIVFNPFIRLKVMVK